MRRPPEKPAASEAPSSAFAAVSERLGAVERERRDVDLVVMANEISFAHGTGILMSRVLQEAPPWVLFRAFDHWGGSQVVKPVADHVFHRYSEPRDVISTFLAARLRPYRIRSILSVPYTREDVVFALAAKALTGAPLVTWYMDDNCVLSDGIPRLLAEELVGAADARFIISDTMRRVYEDRFRRPFWVLPPLVGKNFLRDAPCPPPASGAPKGCIVGNIWHQAWLVEMLSALRDLDCDVEWYTSSNDLYFLDFTEEQLAASGVRICSDLTHGEIASRIEQSSYVLVPSSSGTETDQHAAAIGRLSLPSKMPFVTASSGVPFLVLANAASGAADYVARFGLGEIVRYDANAIKEAIARLSQADVQTDLRARSFSLGKALDVTGTYEFLKKAGETRRLPDDRLELLFSSRTPDGRRSSAAALNAEE